MQCAAKNPKQDNEQYKNVVFVFSINPLCKKLNVGKEGCHTNAKIILNNKFTNTTVVMKMQKLSFSFSETKNRIKNINEKITKMLAKLPKRTYLK